MPEQQTTTTKTTQTQSTPTTTSATSRFRPKSSGYDAQTNELAPGGGDSNSGISVAGVWLSRDAVGATFAALDQVKGPAWTKQAHDAAKSGGAAVLAVFGLPTYAQTDIARDIGDEYAKWAMTPPKTKTSTPKTDPTPHGPLGKAKHLPLEDQGFHVMTELEAYLGSKLGALLPAAGESASASGELSVSVEGVYLALGLDLEAEHGDDDFKISGKAKIAVGLGEPGANGALYATIGLAGKGGDAIEAAHLFGLAIERYLRTQDVRDNSLSWESIGETGQQFITNYGLGQSCLGGPMGGVAFAGGVMLFGAAAADVLWGKNFEGAMNQQMGDGDYAEYGMGVGVQGEISEGTLGLEGGMGYQHVTRVVHGDDGVRGDGNDFITVFFKGKEKAGGYTISASGNGRFALSGNLPSTLGLEVSIAPANAFIEGGLARGVVGNLLRGDIAQAGKNAGKLTPICEGFDQIVETAQVIDALASGATIEIAADLDWKKKTIQLSASVSQSMDLLETPENAPAEGKIGIAIGQEVVARELPMPTL